MLVLTVGSEARTRKYLPDLPITREVDLVCAERGVANDELLALAPDASVVVADAISPIDAQLIAAMPNLKLIHSGRGVQRDRCGRGARSGHCRVQLRGRERGDRRRAGCHAHAHVLEARARR